MPEMHVLARWPDGTTRRHYSPSLVMAEHVDVGAAYAVADFVERTGTALAIASDRVRAKFGFACSRAAASLAAIERLAAGHAPGDEVVVVGFEPG